MSSKPYKDLMYERLIKFKKHIKVFICLRCPEIPEHIEKLKQVALQSDDKNLTGVYQKEGHAWLKPIAEKFIENLNKEIFGNDKTKKKKELFSVYTIETKNRDGTLPDPHLHCVCDDNSLSNSVITEKVERCWQSFWDCELLDDSVRVDSAPFDKGPKAVLRYALKFSSKKYPAIIRPASIARKIESEIKTLADSRQKSKVGKQKYPLEPSSDPLLASKIEIGGNTVNEEKPSTEARRSLIRSAEGRQWEFLTVNDLVKILRISKSKIYQLVKKEKIPHYRIGGTIRFAPKEIIRWIEARHYPVKKVALEHNTIQDVDIMLSQRRIGS
jgi:excisionase family DNA binding protein